MKYKELISLREVLSSLSNLNIKLRSSYNIAKFLHATEDNVSIMQSKIQNVLEDCARRDDQGNIISSEAGIAIQDEMKDTAERALNEIFDFAMDVDKLEIYYDDLPEDSITPSILFSIMPYIVK